MTMMKLSASLCTPLTGTRSESEDDDYNGKRVGKKWSVETADSCDLIAVTGRKYIRTGRWVNFLSNAGTPFLRSRLSFSLFFSRSFLRTNDPAAA